MSTKSTLWHNEVFHLYREGLDDENVYLEISSPHFEELVLKIPLDAWKEMRKHTIEPAERYLDLTDEQLLQEAERAVDKHRAWLDEHRESPIAGLAGFLLFGSPESTREEMIRGFLESYRPELAARLADVPGRIEPNA